ncbi:MAG TPA: hypothetical protein VIQ31_12060 [Phormidium sp.]
MRGKIYISYTSLDKALVDEFLRHLTSFQWKSITTYSYDERQISAIALLDYSPVTSWEEQMESLKSAAPAIYEKILSPTDSKLFGGVVKGIVSPSELDVSKERH